MGLLGFQVDVWYVSGGRLVRFRWTFGTFHYTWTKVNDKIANKWTIFI